MFKVKFLPDEKEIEVDGGTTLMEAAEKAGVYINSLCGGEGVCGRCRVQVADGKIRADKHSISFLSKEEIKDGYVLACQARVNESLEVVIPPKSRLEEEQILMEEAAVDYSPPEKILVRKILTDPMSLFEPIVQKIYLDLQRPSPEDNIADIDRIVRGLRHKTEYASFEISLHCLQGLAAKLRDKKMLKE